MNSFRDSLFYPIIFMLLICFIFVGILAIAYRNSQPKIEAYQQDSYNRLVLGLFASTIASKTESKPLQVMNSYPDSYHSYIKEIKQPGLDRKVFTATVNDTVLGYCYDIGGKGLWGSMRALIVLSPDYATLNGLIVYAQMETPGLGARIGEPWFLDQFKAVPIMKLDKTGLDKVVDFELIPEGKKAVSPTQIQQITGATITTNSVIKMLKNEINYILSNASVQP